MSVTIYGGNKEIVEKQLACDHNWHGPCIDTISRYYKCTKCFCIERDARDWNDYLRLKEEGDLLQMGIGSGSIEAHPDKRGGVPVLEGTRYPIAEILSNLSEGDVTLKQFCDDYDLDFETASEAIMGISTVYNQKWVKD